MSIDSEHPICVKQCDKQDEKVECEMKPLKDYVEIIFAVLALAATGVCVLVFSRGGPGKEMRSSRGHS